MEQIVKDSIFRRYVRFTVKPQFSIQGLMIAYLAFKFITCPVHGVRSEAKVVSMPSAELIERNATWKK